MASIVTGGFWEYWLSGLHHGGATKPNLITAAPQPFIPWATFSIHKEPKDRHVQRRKVILSHVATCLDTKHTPVLILTHSYIHTLHNYICTATQAHGHTLVHIPGSPRNTHTLSHQAHTYRHGCTFSYGNAAAHRLSWVVSTRQ